MKIVAIIQARLGSSRLPGKAALDMHGMPILARVIARCRLAHSVSEVCVATSDQPADDILANIAQRAGAAIFRGPLGDVRQRMLGAADQMGADAFLRLTGDNPLTEPFFLDELIDAKHADQQCPYAVHDLAQVVYGTAAELVDVQALKSHMPHLPVAGKEHVTTGLAQLAGARVLAPPETLSDPYLSLTVDRLDQYQSVWALMKHHGSGPDALARIVTAWRAQEGGAGLYTTRPVAK